MRTFVEFSAWYFGASAVLSLIHCVAGKTVQRTPAKFAMSAVEYAVIATIAACLP